MQDVSERNAEGVHGWVMQCPASRGAAAPLVGRDLVPQVPIFPARFGGSVQPVGTL